MSTRPRERDINTETVPKRHRPSVPKEDRIWRKKRHEKFFIWILLIASSRNQTQTAVSKKVECVGSGIWKVWEKIRFQAKASLGLSPFVSWLCFHPCRTQSQGDSPPGWPPQTPHVTPPVQVVIGKNPNKRSGYVWVTCPPPGVGVGSIPCSSTT